MSNYLCFCLRDANINSSWVLGLCNDRLYLKPNRTKSTATPSVTIARQDIEIDTIGRQDIDSMK